MVWDADQTQEVTHHSIRLRCRAGAADRRYQISGETPHPLAANASGQELPISRDSCQPVGGGEEKGPSHISWSQRGEIACHCCHQGTGGHNQTPVPCWANGTANGVLQYVSVLRPARPNEQELSEALSAERKPRRCPLVRFLRVCGQLGVQARLPACLSLGNLVRRSETRAGTPFSCI